MYTEFHAAHPRFNYLHKSDYFFLECAKSQIFNSGICCFDSFPRPFSIVRMLSRGHHRFVLEIDQHTDPFNGISWIFSQRDVKEILLVTSNYTSGSPELKTSNFKEITTPFAWQGGRSLTQCWMDAIALRNWREFPKTLRKIVGVEFCGDLTM